MPDEGRRQRFATHSLGVNGIQNHESNFLSTRANIRVYSAVDALSKRKPAFHQSINDSLWQYKVVAFLRKTNHLGKNPRAKREDGTSIHFVRVYFVRVMPRAAIARNFVGKTAGTRNRKANCVRLRDLLL